MIVHDSVKSHSKTNDEIYIANPNTFIVIIFLHQSKGRTNLFLI